MMLTIVKPPTLDEKGHTYVKMDATNVDGMMMFNDPDISQSFRD